MTTKSSEHSHGSKIFIEIAGTDLHFREFELETETPTGGKIASIAGFNSDQHAYVLQCMSDGAFEGLRVQEEANLGKGSKFVVSQADHTNRITINGNELDWPAETISGAAIRTLGNVSADSLLYLERLDEPDRLVEEKDSIKVRSDGIEEFKSRSPKVWELNVQGKKIKSNTSTITVVDALTRAGFDPNAWIIILKVKGQQKLQLSVNDTIDLRTLGIEKIRLTAKDVNNGEARSALRRDFALLEVDESYLDDLGLSWETMAAGGHRWLIVQNYPVPAGYTISTTILALLVPPNYPQAQIDMFYVHPPLQKTAGCAIPATDATQAIEGVPFQRWSRHRGVGSPWNPRLDNVVTHLALVESAIMKEVSR